MTASKATPVAERQAPLLAGAPLLIGFAFIMGIVMTVVFPTGREYAELSNERGADAYSIAYLTVLTRANPHDVDLRIVYVRQLAELGRWDQALAVLAQTPAGGRRSADVRALRLELMLAKARELPVETDARSVALAAVHGELVSFIAIAPKERARELALLALELSDPELAARFYLVAAEVGSSSERGAALAAAGRWFRAAGDGDRAAKSYRRAADVSADPMQKGAYLIDAADALEASAGACAGASVLEPAASTSVHVPLVRRATELVVRCDRPADAKRLGRRLVALSGDDAEEMKLQVRRELEAGDAAGALALLRKLVSSRPDDPVLREATARVAEWAGQPQVALRQWLWLLQTGRAPRGRLVLP